MAHHRLLNLAHPAQAVLACIAGIALCGCAGRAATQSEGASAASREASQTLADELAAQYAADMEALAAAAPPEGEGTPVSSRSGVFVERATTNAATPQPAPATDPSPVAAGSEPADPAPTDAAPTPGSAAPSIEQAARELGRQLRARAISGATPYEDLSRVAMLEAIAPGVLEGLGEDASGDAPDLIAVLAPSEREALRAARQAARRLAASDAADPGVAAEALRSAAESLEQSQVVRIPAAALCRRVDGFARYDAFENTTFVAGRTNRMIVYTEVDRFRQTPLEGTTTPGSAAPAGSRFAVRLTQSLNLYFSEGGLLVWRRPPQTVSDYAAARLRDFYIIDTIELPATLAAGSYSLKVVVRDEATGQQAETILPITLVADPSLARGS